MVNLLTATVLVPLLGAGGILLASLLLQKLDVGRSRVWILTAALAVACAAFVLVVVLRVYGGAWTTLSSAQALTLAGSVVRFQAHGSLWPIAMVFTLVYCSYLTAALGHATDTPSSVAGVPLLLLALGLASLWAANPLTMIIAWALYDLIHAWGSSVAGEGGGLSGRSMAIGSAATLLLWIGVLVTGDGTGIVQWSLMPAGGPKMSIWVIAGLLRLGVYPLHFATPSGLEGPSHVAGALFLSPVLGWGLLTRLAVVNGGALPVEPWAALVGALSLAVGGLLAWTTKRSSDVRRWITVSMSGAVFLAAALLSLNVGGQEQAAGLTLAVLTLGVSIWLLTVGLLFVGESLSVSRSLDRRELPLILPPLIGSLVMISVPITLPFLGEAQSVWSFLSSGSWGVAAALLVGQVFLIAAVFRWLLRATLVDDGDSHRLKQVSRVVAAVVPGLCLVVIGLAPSLLLPTDSPVSLRLFLIGPGIGGWLIWVGAFLLGAVLAWTQWHLQRVLSRGIEAVHEFLLLDWAYTLLIGALDQGLAMVRTLDEVLGGSGALLWSFVLLLSLILVLRGR